MLYMKSENIRISIWFFNCQVCIPFFLYLLLFSKRVAKEHPTRMTLPLKALVINSVELMLYLVYCSCFKDFGCAV